MTSAVDATVPGASAALASAPIRSNFSIIKSEISALQSGTVTSVLMGGDVTGPSGSSSVTRLQSGISLSGSPSTGQVLTATSVSTANWQTPAASGLSYVTLTAQGTNQATAQALPVFDFVNVTAGTGGVRWDFATPPSGQGYRISVHNATATTIEFYPKAGASINNLAANAGVGGIPPHTTGVFWVVGATQIFTVP